MRRIIALSTFVIIVAISSLALASTKMSSQGGVWVSGKVTAIEKGPENSLLTLRESNGQIFRVSATNDKLKAIEIGDRVTVKDVNGWASTIKEAGKKTARSSTGLTHRQA
jgi:hypothetical protein